MSHKDRDRVAMTLNCLHKRKAEEAGLVATLLRTDSDLLAPKGPHAEMWLWPGALLTAKVKDARGKLRTACGYKVVRRLSWRARLCCRTASVVGTCGSPARGRRRECRGRRSGTKGCC